MSVRHNWSIAARIPDDLASCLRCRDLIIIERSKRGSYLERFRNPQRYHQLLIKNTLGRHWQGYQMPSGSYHYSDCLPFDITSARRNAAE